MYNYFDTKREVMMIDDTDFNLSNPRVRLFELTKLKSEKSKLLWTENGREVRQVGNTIGMIALVDQKPDLVYAVKFTETFDTLVKHAVTQVAVWRDPVDTGTRDISARVFWEILLPRKGTIRSDSMQTDRGRRFWAYQLDEAFNKGYKVYYCTYGNHRNLTELHSISDYRDSLGIVYGDTEKFKLVRLLISKHDLITSRA